MSTIRLFMEIKRKIKIKPTFLSRKRRSGETSLLARNLGMKNQRKDRVQDPALLAGQN